MGIRCRCGLHHADPSIAPAERAHDHAEHARGEVSPSLDPGRDPERDHRCVQPRHRPCLSTSASREPRPIAQGTWDMDVTASPSDVIEITEDMDNERSASIDVTIPAATK